MSTPANNASELYSRLANRAEDKGAPLNKSEWLETAGSFLGQLLTELETNNRFNKGRRYPDVLQWQTIALRKYHGWSVNDVRKSYFYWQSLGWRRGKSAVVDWQALIDNAFEEWAGRPENAGKTVLRSQTPPQGIPEPQGWTEWVKANLPENWRGFSLPQWPMWSQLTPEEQGAIDRQMR